MRRENVGGFDMKLVGCEQVWPQILQDVMLEYSSQEESLHSNN